MPGFAESNRTRLWKTIPGAVTGLGASKTAVVKIPPGATYDELMLQCTIAGTAATRAEIEAMLLECRLSISGKEIWSLTATQLIAIAEWYNVGVVGGTGFLRIPINRYWMTGPAAQIGPDLGSLGESSVELTIAQAAGNTIDAVTVCAGIRPVAEELGAHVRIQRLTPNMVIGENVFTGIAPSPNEFLYALHYQCTSAYDMAKFTKLTVEADGVRLVDDLTWTQIEQLTLLTGPRIRTSQNAKKFRCMDFVASGLDDDALRMNFDQLVQKLTFATTNPDLVQIIAEIGTIKPSQLR